MRRPEQEYHSDGASGYVRYFGMLICQLGIVASLQLLSRWMW
jgi:hypothetical protein